MNQLFRNEGIGIYQIPHRPYLRRHLFGFAVHSRWSSSYTFPELLLTIRGTKARRLVTSDLIRLLEEVEFRRAFGRTGSFHHWGLLMIGLRGRWVLRKRKRMLLLFWFDFPGAWTNCSSSFQWQSIWRSHPSVKFIMQIWVRKVLQIRNPPEDERLPSAPFLGASFFSKKKKTSPCLEEFTSIHPL